jgi:nicotinamidase/pyrazinamidase
VAGSQVVEVGEAFEPAASLPGHVTIHKQRYDMFSNPEAERIVERYAAGDPTFVVYGVATDYCVKAAVEGLHARGCRVAVVVDAIRAIDPGVEAALLTGWAREGVGLVRTQVVCGEAGA